MPLFQEKLLNGRWQLKDEILTFDLSNARELSEAADGWLDQPVPGDIHQGLVAAGKIKEPLVGLNFFDCKWTETRSWWLRKTFDVPADFLEAGVVELEMNGLDSNAEIFLNGRHVASHRNAFRPLVKDVKSYLKAGRNTLLVRLTAGLENITETDVNSTDGVVVTTEADQGRPERGDIRRAFVRKPQYSFGWDWSPRAGTTAIAGDVKIRAINTACIRRVNLHPVRHGQDGVFVMAVVIVDGLHYYKTFNGTVTVTLADNEGRKFTAQTTSLLRSGYNYIKLAIHVAEPKLWWPNGLGAQHLYKVEASLQIGGESMEYPAFDYGLRFVRLDTQDKFAVIVNGKKVFCKGANWIPADAIYARVSDDRYDQLIRQAKDADFNMLRVWGGGLYERDAFYRACDKYGIMLWHDFMFACGPFPDQLEWFRAEVEKEADYQTARLSRYACIVLWCGNNENHWAFRDWWNQQTKAGAYLYNYLLPAAVQRNCPEIPYWNGSPYGGSAPNDHDVGDCHHWNECMMNPDMQKRITPQEYDKCNSLFVSEFGYVGACGKETVLTYMDGARLDPKSETWQQHTNVFEKNTVEAGIRKHYADPENLGIDDYLLFSGLCQGLMYQYALESMRYRSNCYGALFWMFSDCWGEVGWTIIDYYLRRKISWYFARRAFAPIRLIMRRAENGIRLVAANDTPQTLPLDIEYGYMALDGKSSELKSCEVDVPALERAECCLFDKADHDPARGLWIARCINNPDVAPAIFRATDYRNLKTAEPKLSVKITDAGKGRYTAKVAADVYAHAVHFKLPGGSMPSDNYFDLLPGESREITISSAQPIDEAAIGIDCVNNLKY